MVCPLGLQFLFHLSIYLQTFGQCPKSRLQKNALFLEMETILLNQSAEARKVETQHLLSVDFTDGMEWNNEVKIKK